MQNELLTRILKIFPMTDEEIHAFNDRNTVKKFKKGDILIREGDRLDRVFFVMEGIVRQYTLNDGREKSVFFYVENQMIRLTGKDGSSSNSFHYLECLEDSTISIAYSRADDQEFIQKYPRFESLCRMLSEDIFKQAQGTLEDYLHGNPLDRYQMLLEKRPDLVQRVSQQHLASYLGFTPESLSRIKKRIFTKKKLSEL